MKLHAFKITVFSVIFSLIFGPAFGLLGTSFSVAKVEAAAPQTINYQGKLYASSSVAVPNGTYNIEFKLYASSTSVGSSQGTCSGDAQCLWVESRTSANKVTVTNGLFSVLLGNVTSLASINFNQQLYLSVNIGGTSSPAWDGEMSPRKALASAPSALTALSLNGYSDQQFLRSDVLNSTSSAATFFQVQQNGAGKLAEFFGPATTSVLSLLNNGNVGVGSSTPFSKLTVNGDAYFTGIITSASTTGTSTFSNALSAAGLITASNGLSIADAKNIVLGTGTGTQLGTATNQKLGFFGATPIVQLANNTDLRQGLINLGFLASGGATPLNLNGGNLTAATGTFSGGLSFSGPLNAGGSAGTAGQLLQSTGPTGIPTYVSTSSLGFGLSGGANGYLARWTGASTLSTGLFIDDGTVAGINATSATTTFNIRGTAGLNPFAVASSTGTNLFTIEQNGDVSVTGNFTTNTGNISGGRISGNPFALSGNFMYPAATFGAGVRFTDGSGSTISSGGLELYNAYTNTTNYERGSINWNGNVLEVGVTALGTGVNRNLLLKGATVNIGTSTGVSLFNIQGASTSPNVSLLSIASSSGASYVSVLANGNVGIGSSSPNATLSLVGPTSGGIGGFVPDALAVYGASGAVSGGNIILRSGNAASGAGGYIDIKAGGGSDGTGGAINLTGGDASASGGTGGDLNFTAGLSGSSAYGGNVNITGGGAGGFGAFGGNVVINAGVAGGVYGKISLATAGGNVGVGTTTASDKFTVVGSMNLTGAFKANGSAGSNGQILQTTGTGTQWVSTSSLGIGASLSGGTLGYVARWTSASTLSTGLFIDNGTVSGINATSSTTTFNVAGNAGVNAFNVASSTGLSLFTVAQNGNVGIGITNPFYAKLEIRSDGLGTTTSPTLGAATNGIALTNTTVATNGFQQYSPAITWMGNGYETFDPASSPVSFRAFLVPIQGSVHPTGNLTFQSYDGTGYVDRFVISTGGAIGVGTTTTTNTLSLNGRAGIGASYAGIAAPTNGLIVQGNVGIGTSSPIAQLALTGTGGTNPFIIASSTGTHLLTLLQNGNFGIGSSTPSDTLSVTGSFNLTGAFKANGSAGSSGMVLQTTGSGTQWVATSSLGISGGAGLSGGTNGYLARWTGASTLSTGLFIDDGTVAGVNATSSATTFNVKGSAGLNPFAVASSTGLNLFTILQNGNVGIGITSPDAPLTFATSLGDKINLYSGGGGQRWGFGIQEWTFAMYMDPGNPGVGKFSWRNSDSSGDASNGSDVMNLFTSGQLDLKDTTNGIIRTYGSGNNYFAGNVGIGTSSPSDTLSVTGSFNLTGAFKANGSAGSNGQILQTTGSVTQWVATSSLGIIPTTSSVLKGNGGGAAVAVSNAYDINTLDTMGDANKTVATTTDVLNLTAAFTAIRTITLPAASSYTNGRKLYVYSNGKPTISNYLKFIRGGSDTLGGLTTDTNTQFQGPSGTGNFVRYEFISDGVSSWDVTLVYVNGGSYSTQVYNKTLSFNNAPFFGIGAGFAGGSAAVQVTSNGLVTFSNDGSNYSFQVATGLGRTGQGILEVNNGTLGTWRDLIARNISLGTTSTSSVFTIQGTTTAPTTSLFTVASTTGSTLLTVLANGTVGVGTTTPTATFKLGVAGDINFTGNLYQNGTLVATNGSGTQWTTSGTNIYFNGTNGSVGIGTTSAAQTLTTAGTFSVFSTTSNVTSIFTDGTTGNVGIGTTSPTERLTIEGGNVLIGKRVNATGTYTDLINTTGTIQSGGTASLSTTTAMAVWNGSVYAGVMKTGAAEVYRYNGGTGWTKVSSTTAGVIGGSGTQTNTIASIASMAVYNGQLYIGTAKTGGAEVYRYEGNSTWTKVSSTTAGSIGGNATTTAIDSVSAMAIYNGQLYIGTAKTGGAEVYRFNGLNTSSSTQWTRVNNTVVATGAGTFGAATLVNSVNAMSIDNGALYVGVSKLNSAAVYRYEGSNAATPMLLMNSAVGTFGASTAVDNIRTMAVYNGATYIGIDDGANTAQVVRFDGTVAAGNSFTQVSSSTVGTIETNVATQNLDRVSAMSIYKDSLYVGIYEPAGAILYKYSGGTNWTRVSSSTAGYVSKVNASTTADGVTALVQAGDSLFVGTEKVSATQVFSYNVADSESYALEFNAAATTSESELNGFKNYGDIKFVAGNTNSDGTGNTNNGKFVFSHGITSAIGAYDVAEDYPTRDDSLAAGDIVSIDTREKGMVRKSVGKDDAYVIGVYSKDPAFRLSQSSTLIDGARAIPIALAGRVPVTVSLENGPIAIGDYITASTVGGVGAKATKPGRVLGRALSPYSGAEGEDPSVTVFLGVESVTWNDIQQARTDAAAVTDELSSGTNGTVGEFVESVNTAISDIAFMVLNKADNLAYFITNKMSALVANISSLFVKDLTVIPGGTLTIPRGSQQIAGSGSIPEGQFMVTISNRQVTEGSLISITPTSAVDSPLYVTDITPGVGFTVRMARSQTNVVTFSWFMINTYDPETANASSTGTSTPPIITIEDNSSTTSSVGTTTITNVSSDGDYVAAPVETSTTTSASTTINGSDPGNATSSGTTTSPVDHSNDPVITPSADTPVNNTQQTVTDPTPTPEPATPATTPADSTPSAPVDTAPAAPSDTGSST